MKSLERRWEKNFEIFRPPSVQTDILPKYSVGCPWHDATLNKRLSFFFQALDVVLEELTGHLDEDIQELLEREKQRNMALVVLDFQV